jgi:hypothetical protein
MLCCFADCHADFFLGYGLRRWHLPWEGKMLYFFIVVIFVSVGIIAVFSIISSCKHASKKFHSLMNERDVLSKDWAEVEIGFPLPSFDPNVLGPICSKAALRSQLSNQLSFNSFGSCESLQIAWAADARGVRYALFFRVTPSLPLATVEVEVA